MDHCSKVISGNKKSSKFSRVLVYIEILAEVDGYEQ